MWEKMGGMTMDHEINVTDTDSHLYPVLGRIMAESFRAAFAGFITQETLDRCAIAEKCGALLENLPGEMTTLTGWLDGKPMGLLVFTAHEKGGAEIEAIHSLPESWGTGLGVAMLARLKNFRQLGLWAFEKNARARRFYEKHGFAFTGERRISEFDGAIEVRYERTWHK